MKYNQYNGVLLKGAVRSRHAYHEYAHYLRAKCHLVLALSHSELVADSWCLTVPRTADPVQVVHWQSTRRPLRRMTGNGERLGLLPVSTGHIA